MSISRITSINSDVIEKTFLNFLNPPHPWSINISPNAHSPSSEFQPSPTISTSTLTITTSNSTSKSSESTPVVKNVRKIKPADLQITIDKNTTSGKKKYDLLNDPLVFDSGNLAPVHHPLNYPSVLNTVSKIYKANPDLEITFHLHTRLIPHLFFKFRSIVLSITLFLLPLANCIISVIGKEKELKMFYLQFNFLNSTKVDISINPNDSAPPSNETLHHPT